MALNVQQTDNAGLTAIGGLCAGVVGGNASGAANTSCSIGGTPGAVPLAPSIQNASNVVFQLFEWIPPAGTNWNLGNWTVRLNITAAFSSRGWASVYICRVDSSGVNQETLGSNVGSDTSNMGSTGVLTKTVMGSAPSVVNTGDRVVIVLLSMSATMSVPIGAITPDQLIDTPFTAPAPASGGSLLMMGAG